MGRYKKNGAVQSQKIHLTKLVPSTRDLVELGAAVQERFVKVLNLWLRVHGEPLVPDAEYDQDMINWRQMVMRHKEGDYRNTEDEKRSVRRIAQWTLDVNAELTKTPRQVLEWGD